MKFGFLGVGNMAAAIMKGMCLGNSFDNADVLGYNRTAAKVEKLSEEYGLTTCYSVKELIEKSDVVVLSVKPQVLPDVMPEVKELLREGQLVISIAAGKEISYLQENLGEDAHVVRVMPNVNAQALMSTSCFTCSENVTDEEKEVVKTMFGEVGSIVEIEEHQFAVFTAVGCASPAFTYIYIDALARAGVKWGLPKDVALEIAASSVLGSAKMVMESDKHPFGLMDEVCSPGGTTIEGVCQLQDNNFMSTVEKAVSAVIEKDMSLK